MTSIPGSDEPRGRRLPRYAYAAPRLIVMGRGEVSAQLAERLAHQCDAEDISKTLMPVDELGAVELGRYGEIALCLPDSPGGAPAIAMRPYVEVIRRYRASQPYVLADLLAERKQWFEVGVVQIFGLHVTALHPLIRRAFPPDVVDVWHPVTPGQAVDLLEAYRQNVPAVVAVDPEPGTYVDELFEAQKARLRSWGVVDLDHVRQVVELLNGERPRYRDPKRPVTTRCPLGDQDGRSALDLILDGGWESAALRAQKTHRENFARVWREDIQPKLGRLGLRRPGNGNAKFAVEDLHKLYAAARAVLTLGDF